MQACWNQGKSERRPRLFRNPGIKLLVCAIWFFATSPILSAAVFHVPAGDVPRLIAAINAANANGEKNTIILEAGTYTLTKADNGTGFDHTGLPVISSLLTIRGARAGATIIERDVTAEGFRLMKVAATGTLTLTGLTLRNGGSRDFRSLVDFGGGIYNDTGTVTLINCILTHNMAQFSGGIYNGNGTVTLTKSTLVANDGSSGTGGIENAGGTLTLTNSTVANNRGDFDGGGIVSFAGIVAITNSTIVDNVTEDSRGGGIAGGLVTLQNTIVALNRQILPGAPPQSGDCFGSLTSLGTNLIGDPTGCNISLVPTDLTGDPGLGAYLDDGAAGNGRFPLVVGSQAISAGNDATCSPTDQLGTPRNGPCDIGAVEFYPVVNDLVGLANITKAFDPSPVPGGPAGTFLITADFANTSSQAIVNPFVEVVELTGGNLLLNAVGGVGGVGARLTSNGSGTPLEPGASSTFEFLIGLQQREPFTFLVNMLGEPRISNLSVGMR